MKRPLTVCLVLLGVVSALAEETQSPYAGQEARDIKALSPAEIAGYQAGHGMGFARVAELNHYPGPKHVLELAGELEITDEQRTALRGIFDVMHERAVALGQELVERERGLDDMLAAGTTDAKAVSDAIAEIARVTGELRFAHVAAHLETRAVLSAEQTDRYDQLRGYAKR